MSTFFPFLLSKGEPHSQGSVAIKGRDTTLKSFQVAEFVCWDGSPEFIQALVIDSVVGIRGKFARYLGPDFGFHLA